MFQKSLFFMEKEKLTVLVKELKSPYLISDFYYGDGSSDKSDKKDLEHDFFLLKEEIIIIRDRVENNFKNLEKQMDFMEKNPHMYEIQSLIYLDILRKYISNEIRNIGKINQKISQLLRDGYHQYLPKPVLGKRFSSVNITSQVEKSLTLRLRQLRDSEKSKNSDSLIVWDYTENYEILVKENYTSFRLPYWYFEFSYFLPNLTHEIGHKVFETKKYKKIQNRLKESIDIIIKEKKDIFKNIDFKYIPETLSKEILADTVAFTYHGASFFYALTHKFLSTGLSTMFKANEKRVYDKNYTIIDTQNINIESSFDFFSKYKFEDKKDFLFIRLYILLQIQEKILKDDNSQRMQEKFIIEDKYGIERLLNSIYTINNIEYSRNILSNLKLIFKYSADIEYQKGYQDTYLIVKTLSTEISKSLLEKSEMYFFRDQKANLIEEKSEYEEIPKHFNDIWNKRFIELEKSFTKSVHRFEFRKKLHKETILKLIQTKMLSLDNLKPYNMVFFKYNLDSVKDIYNSDLKVSFSDNTREVEQGLVFGIYDYVYLRELNSKYRLNIISFKYKEYEEKNIKYYESAYSLIKIMDDSLSQSIDSKYHLSAIIQIEIPKVGEELNSREIYDDLFRDLKKIKNIFENKKNPLKYQYQYQKIEYFKSLGPKDITIRINSASIDLIFEVKKRLAREFKRTFTTFYLNNIDLQDNIYEKIFSCNRYTFVSNLRMHPDYDDSHNDEFLKLCRYEKNIEKVVHKTGVMDFQLTWKANIPFQKVVDFYVKLITHKSKIVIDIQTGIDKNINLHVCTCDIC